VFAALGSGSDWWPALVIKEVKSKAAGISDMWQVKYNDDNSTEELE
jgi:hypothetical protein